jgi:glyoxylase-like metal-dependent hydrolase (beta-lactamase superfamily II)
MRKIIEKLSDGVYFIQGARNARYPNSNSILIGDFLIDTGISNKILRSVKKEYQINNVILSHWHEDHISGNRLLKGVNFFCHEKDKLIIENIEKMNEYYDIKDKPIGKDFLSLLDYLRMENTEIDSIITDNEIFEIGDRCRLKVIHTSGHTAGHCAFYEMNSKIGFFADIDLTKFPYYGNIDANLMDFETSIVKLMDFEFNKAITGHRGIIEGDSQVKEELKKFKFIINKRDERILEQLSEKKVVKLEDLRGKNLIYKKYMYEEFEIIAELLMIKKHFDKFLKQDKISVKDNGYILN